ncbi:hypothetical protein BD626DRAFT_27480 [Schizophyllum amplum]|uniref:Uncharacterized protein n=1 Tax=Schizophyllum amplum TaxID=97359 RepID=A0A550CZX5_9AGAR|nr:hypothetical protein BD626DRAFT_27480 [Auriculariopsis ampla]
MAIETPSSRKRSAAKTTTCLSPKTRPQRACAAKTAAKHSILADITPPAARTSTSKSQRVTAAKAGSQTTRDGPGRFDILSKSRAVWEFNEEQVRCFCGRAWAMDRRCGGFNYHSFKRHVYSVHGGSRPEDVSDPGEGLFIARTPELEAIWRQRATAMPFKSSSKTIYPGAGAPATVSSPGIDLLLRAAEHLKGQENLHWENLHLLASVASTAVELFV